MNKRQTNGGLRIIGEALVPASAILSVQEFQPQKFMLDSSVLSIATFACKKAAWTAYLQISPPRHRCTAALSEQAGEGSSRRDARGGQYTRNHQRGISIAVVRLERKRAGVLIPVRTQSNLFN